MNSTATNKPNSNGNRLIVRRIWPYLKRHKVKLLVGLAFLLINNYVAVRIPRHVGQAFEFLANAFRTQTEDLSVFYGELMWVLILALLSAVMLFSRRLLMITASRDMEYDFRNDVFAKLQNLSPSYFDRHPTGDLMSRATNDLDAIRDIMGPGIMYMADSLTVFPFALIAMTQYSLALTGLALIPIGLFAVIVRLVMGRIFFYSKARQDLLGEISADTQEFLSGVRVVKAYGQQENRLAQFKTINQRFVDANLSLARLRALLHPSIQMVILLGYALLLTFGGRLVFKDVIGLGELIAFLGIYRLLIWPVVGFGFVLSLWQRGAAAMARVEDIISARSDVTAPEAAADAGSPVRLTGPIEIRNLTFAYPGGDGPVLHDLSLTIPAGRSLGIIGPTGAGKSTLVSLIPHFYPVARDQIRIGGRDINDIPLNQLRHSIGYVPQETFLFSDSIRGNVAFSDPAHAERDARVEAATRISRLAADVEGFPQGLDTRLGERGINLSGGQKQRASIARAVFRDPEILILDDALSAVDTETEEQVLEQLSQFMDNRTTILISHRVSAVRLCDDIVVIHEGRVAEQGTHEDLLERNGLYTRIHQAQQLAREIEEENGSTDFTGN